MTSSLPYLQTLRDTFGERLQVDVPLKRYTAARIGGNADYLVSVGSFGELAEAVDLLWKSSIPFIVLGSGSNVLVSDAGVRGVVIINRAGNVRFNTEKQPPTVMADSGANLGALARRAATHGLAGLEWASGIPGTVGGAVYGNAGAHGGDIARCLVVAKILHLKSTNGAGEHEFSAEEWSVDRFDYAYRSSQLKRQPGRYVVQSAEFKLQVSTVKAVRATMDEYKTMRQMSQPPGASMGSIFKNPPGDFAGRLIDAAGLKGTAIGKVEVSRKHANFFINHENATARDYAALIQLAQRQVFQKFGVMLELEIEQLGDWSGMKG